VMRRRYRAGDPAWGMPTRRRHGALGRTGRSCFFVLCPEPERMSCVVLSPLSLLMLFRRSVVSEKVLCASPYKYHHSHTAVAPFATVSYM
jgi:hypothetical protein